jgi:hypothetical protein
MTWQPIETAPKDGTDVLAWDGDSVSLVWWSVGAKKWAWGDFYLDAPAPTHWMPLPPPPEDKP